MKTLSIFALYRLKTWLPVLICSAFLMPVTPGPGAAQAADADISIDKAMRNEVVEAVARYAEANYVIPDLAPAIARAIRKNQKKGAYDHITSALELKTRLTADLQAAVPDRHLKVFFSAEPRPVRDVPEEPSAEEEAQRRLGAVRQNFSIERAEHLDGNVGYLKIRKFEDPAIAAETLVAAMRFLADTDALLIDLRQNGGGYGAMVDLFTSYFFDTEPVHLADAYDRSTGKTSQSWTLPYVPGPRYLDKPLFIITSGRTFSAAEGFTYCLQKTGRATVVGETTGGGAHFVHVYQINPHFAVMVPVGTVKSAVTGSDWEGTGVVPDTPAPLESAVRTAHRLALERLLEAASPGKWAEYLAMLVGEMKEESAPGPQTAPSAPAATIEYDACVGRYEAPMGTVDIARSGDGLIGKLDSGETIALEPQPDGRFAVRALGAIFEFVRDEAGKVTHIHVDMNGGTFDAGRVN